MIVSNLAQLGKTFVKLLKRALNAVIDRYRNLRQHIPGLLYSLIVFVSIGVVGSVGCPRPLWLTLNRSQ